MERTRTGANAVDVPLVAPSRVVDASRERATMAVKKNVERDECVVEEYSNPYWDEIAGHIDDVTDGMNIAIGLPPRRKMYEMVQAGAVLDLISNPYKSQPFDVQRYEQSLYHRRKELCAKYCWAIPDPATLDFLVEWCGSSVVEIGAGTGYFAWQLSQRGIEVHAYDIAPPQISTENWYHSPMNEEHSGFRGLTREVYFPVEVGSPETLTRHAESTLFLCWPPMGDMATECLNVYRGKRVVVIGESSGGCTADDAFFTLLEENWHEVAEHRPIQWDGIHDYVQVFERGKE
jgi:hypothetical protein